MYFANILIVSLFHLLKIISIQRRKGEMNYDKRNECGKNYQRGRKNDP